MGNFIADFINIAAIVLFFRLIFNFVIGIKNLVQSKGKEKQKVGNNIVREASELEAKPEMVHDVVCNSFIPKDDVYIAVIDGKRHYFCSWECRQKFIEDKKKSVEVSPSQAS